MSEPASDSAAAVAAPTGPTLPKFVAERMALWDEIAASKKQSQAAATGCIIQFLF